MTETKVTKNNSSTNTSIKNNRPKKRNFLGCLTCRKRKVKCDGRRPKCLRCEKSNKPCEGFDFKLKFSEILTIQNGKVFSLKIDIEKNEYKRQQLPLMKMPPSCYYGTFKELDFKINEVDSLIHDENSKYNFDLGPFTVFTNETMFTKYKKSKSKPIVPLNPPKIPINVNNNHMDVMKKAGSNINTNRTNNLPSISSIMNMNHSEEMNTSTTAYLQSNPKLLPLPPALEMNYQRKKQQTQRDLINKLGNNANNYIEYDGTHRIMDNVESNPIWIHPRLEIDAILTYQALVGSADVVTQSWDIIKGVIFADKYGMTSRLQNRIVDKMYDDSTDNDEHMKECINHVFRALTESDNTLVSAPSFTALLRSQRVQELIRLFVKSQTSVMILNFNGSIFDTVVIPSLYKIVGELMVFDCSVGLPGDWSGKVSENGIEFRHYCDLLKRTYCMVVLAITAFSQYKKLFNEYGIYDGSLKLFKCYISFREMSLINLSIIIKPLLLKGVTNPVKIDNAYLLNRLFKAGLFKELILTLILAIYQDSNLDIINNYRLIYNVLGGIKEQYILMKISDKQIDEIWLWFRYIQVFYKSCSKIDLDNYKIDEEGFEDVSSNYNLIENFEFNDYFDKSEYNKIEIAPNSMTSKQDNTKESEDDDVGDSDSDDNDISYSSDSTGAEDFDIQIPKRLTKRPCIEDRPPKSFTVRFHFDENAKNKNKPGNIDERDSEQEDYNDENGSNEMKSLKETNKFGKYNIKCKNSGSKKVNPLTGLSSESNNMTFDERERFFREDYKVHIPNPSKLASDMKQNKFSSVSIVEISFGIPLSLLELIEKTVRLADHKNWCLRKKIFPRNFPKFCCDLEEELINWKTDWDLYTVDTNNTEILQFHSLFHKALYHLTVAFYNTTLLFFFRLIKEIDPNLLQNHVVSTITHLEQLKNLSLRSDFLKDMKIFPPFWCFFISGSNAISSELQYRFDELARKWFVAGNKWIGKQIMMEVWRVGNELSNNSRSGDVVSWLDLIKDWEVSGFH